MMDDISMHVFKGVKLMGIYDKTTGFPRLDNELLNHEDASGVDRDGDDRFDVNQTREGLESFMDLVRNLIKPEVNEKSENRFRFITEEMVTLYSKKNEDYGDAFTQSLDEDGLLVSKIRIKDKLNRFSQLIDNDALVDDESMRDTLIDLANYTVMTLIWLDSNE